METRIERNVDPAEIEEFLKPYLRRSMKDLEKDFRFLSKHYSELSAQYPDEWVAILDCQVIEHGKDHAQLLRRLDDKALRGYSPVVEFLWATPVKFVF